jgi:hypothetical protein
MVWSKLDVIDRMLATHVAAPAALTDQILTCDAHKSKADFENLTF